MDHTITISGRDATFPAGSGQSVLEAALRANQWLPHACSQGTCGTCKIRVVCGEVEYGTADESILSQADRQAGLALACQSSPRTDVTVAPLDEGAPDGPVHMLRDHRGTVVELSEIACRTRRLVIELDDPMEFSAGQYAELIVPGRGIARQYSMANPPSESTRLEFHIRLTEGGLATERWIFASLAEGDRVDLRGPFGRFVIQDTYPEPAILIGGGTGLAPLKSMVRHALSNDLLPEIHLFHGGRRETDLYDVEYFRALEVADCRFHYHPVLSEEKWDGATGMVTGAVVDNFASCKGYRGYLCGPPAMITAAVKALKRRRMAPRLIFREAFTTQQDVVSVPV
ncbi:2Fe-2S iron-sulfur cluster binding domain-containing protein [Rhodococcus sp. HNM0563]|uniref:NADH:ubiquinone reductase (Na(+)-transporting) subunit F n=1 Tax=Rhodococcus sp. HNM0563 TaxID=2716339 RepID=UPI00146EB1C8|nr:2Fe-2S iron-sulfur cluster-binding protein [Rhodococcus sp. HNM0563]NLU64004.1 2Fe-2S iron-sulfur cluster binding domain-containing protein [Rhodococcus sp. HNM0563]